MTIETRFRVSAGRVGREVMSQALLSALRDRVESRYYDRPEVVDALARAMSSRAAH